MSFPLSETSSHKNYQLTDENGYSSSTYQLERILDIIKREMMNIEKFILTIEDTKTQSIFRLKSGDIIDWYISKL